MSYPLQCACGRLQGDVSHAEKVMARGLCYCRDCQAFAHFLGRSGDILNGLGGTEVVAIAPRYVSFRRGLEALACMSLSGRGLLRWYASCCNTAVANTARNPQLAYVGLVHTFLDDSSVSPDEAFGPVRMSVNTQSAKGRVQTMPLQNAAAILKCAVSMAGSRLSGSYRETPFFKAGTDEPIVPPRVLSKDERAALMADI
jgi:hypothetical protein